MRGRGSMLAVRIRSLILVLAAFWVVVGFGGTAAAGPDTAGQAIAFAHVTAGGGIAAFGGKGTSSATVINHPAAGVYDVSFSGKYPNSITPASLILSATAQSFDFDVSNAIVVSASPSKIVVKVRDFTSSADTEEDNDVFLVVFFGR